MAAVSAAALHREVGHRDRLVAFWLQRKASRAELKDLTDFMHDGSASLARCASCGLLVRQEDDVRSAASYEEDPNDPDLMQHLLPWYVQAFRNKGAAYRDLLQPRASVVELGSHLGGFLQVAEEWNWRATGLDIGKDTAEFVKHRGLTVRRETIEDTKLAAGSADAIFVWNCFEQLADPGSMLAASRRLLHRHGLLVLRVPDADFYLQGDREALAWNNLLGFPYLYGYTDETLNRLVTRYGFEPVDGYNSELVTMPVADPRQDVRRQQTAVSRRVAAQSSRATRRRGALTGPWIELIYRKIDEAGKGRPCPGSRFLKRAAP
jgi:SAM-dependent methyltransferase